MQFASLGELWLISSFELDGLGYINRPDPL